MGFDRTKLLAIFDKLGSTLTKPTTICIIGSAPGIASGQPERQTGDMDVWRDQSRYDDTAFRIACEEAGVLFDPRGEINPESVYVQVIRKGVVNLPKEFDVEILGDFGNLRVVMPDPSLLVAAKLVRGSPRDIQDAVWWMQERALRTNDIRDAIGHLPDPIQREAAGENIVLVGLIDSTWSP
ncbi:DUF6036 family nucleotidyltransferase [Rhodopseudomonas sp.]|uniref:DUF6036 family nucleotidyltransferase n=1 Tax=Rhodopseudomonas sp. TaxID=1078 RepID=UPI0039E308B0